MWRKSKTGSAEHLLRRPPEHPLRGRRDVGDARLGVDQQQGVRAVLDEGAEPLFARPQRGFGVPALLLLRVKRQRMADGPLEPFDREIGLAEIVGGAGLHRLDRDVFRAATGEDDDRREDAALADVPQQAQPVPRAESVVEERDVEGLPGKACSASS